MQILNQKTLLKPVSFEGIGLHSGVKTKVKLLPALENEGIVFKRTDLKTNNYIKANFQNVSSAKLCTTITNEYGVSVSTVEHLMAAFYILEIDNAVIEIDNLEVPIMDGSSKDFIEEINKVGLKNLFSKKKYLKILKTIKYTEGEKSISIEPSNESLKVDFELNYTNELIGKQRNIIDFNHNDLQDVITARTFCLFEDVEKIKKAGLAKGGSLENAVVVKGKEVLNEGGLRSAKEFVNHKILDLAGDFLLSGYRILGNVKCVQGGHSLSNIFLREIFKDLSNIEEAVQTNAKILKKDFKTSINKLAVNA
jgi:UDP-3-O-[3-hydroxymyristoyl] N-acetylglucosamine deacetylase|tara:strand:+ start:1973 stop:2899 length:927 start_codon:yes stop_codon:yes gene_type:complete